MSYLVKYTGNGTAGLLEPQGQPVYWKPLDTNWVNDACIDFYQKHPSVFTVLKDPSDIADLVTEDTDGAAYIVDVIESTEGAAAVEGIIDSPYIENVITTGFPGTPAAGYIDFNTTGEPGMAVTIAGVTYQEADTAAVATGVWTNGSSAANSATSLIAAINGDTRATVPFTAAADVSGAGVWLYADAVGADGNMSISTTTPTKITSRPAAQIHFAAAGEAAMAVTIGGVVYQEADTAAPTTGVWTNGASAENSVDSLIAAINGDTRAAVPFTAYKVGTADVFLSWDDAEETDAFVISETSATNCTVYQASYLAFSGVGAPKTNVVINGFIFNELDTASAGDGVWTNGASAADSATSLIAAINGDTTPGIVFTAVTAGSGAMWISQDVAGAARATITTNAISTSCTVGNMAKGKDAAIAKIINITHTVTANELLSGSLDFPIPSGLTPESWHVQAYTSTGAPVYFTDLVTWEASPVNMIRIATTGATNIAATDKVHLVVII